MRLLFLYKYTLFSVKNLIFSTICGRIVSYDFNFARARFWLRKVIVQKILRYLKNSKQ